jgi:hypothetical protein
MPVFTCAKKLGFESKQLHKIDYFILKMNFCLKNLKKCINGGCVTRGVALPFTFKSILRQKKNYGNSNISPCRNIIFKKIL